MAHNDAVPSAVHVAFLGCGFITGVHSRNLRRLRGLVAASYASRDARKAEAFRARHGGVRSYGAYGEALGDRAIDVVVVAVPPRFHLPLTLQALAAGKHVLVEKPAFPRLADYERVREARARAGRVVLVGENDHYKPLAVCLRRLVAERAIGDILLASFTTLARRLKTAGDWRNDEALAGGDAFFEEGIHWLHLANSLGPAITAVQGFRPPPASAGPDRRPRACWWRSATTPAPPARSTIRAKCRPCCAARGCRSCSGRDGIITFESNGAFVLVRGRARALPRMLFPGLRDVRGYPGDVPRSGGRGSRRSRPRR